jgi:anaerobic ribonucleoside-triphosphate reductase
LRNRFNETNVAMGTVQQNRALKRVYGDHLLCNKENVKTKEEIVVVNTQGATKAEE